jgi:hypothetical protein
MANYIVEGCLDGLEYIVSASTTLSPLEVIGFNFGEESEICGTVISVTEDEPIPLYSYSHPYTDCCDCFTGGTLQSLEFQNCDGTTFLYSISGFCEVYGSNPRKDEVFQFSENEVFFCATFIDGKEDLPDENNYFPEAGPFVSCSDCESDIPRSANTEATVCVICCDCGATGSTINQITPPNPVWTDGFGTDVTQLNMIVLGGPRGLNS